MTDRLDATSELERPGHSKLKSREADGGFGIAGGSPGVNTFVEWNPKSEYSVIVLSNYDPPSAESIARKIGLWLPR